LSVRPRNPLFSMVKIIGIDPGLAGTGVGIVRGLGKNVEGYSFGSINTSKNISLPVRLDQIFSNIFLLAGCRAGVPVTEVAVREAKQVLTGNGNASKDQLEKAVRHFLNHKEPIRPFHVSDAMGMALIGLFRYRAV